MDRYALTSSWADTLTRDVHDLRQSYARTTNARCVWSTPQEHDGVPPRLVSAVSRPGSASPGRGGGASGARPQRAGRYRPAVRPSGTRCMLDLEVAPCQRFFARTAQDGGAASSRAMARPAPPGRSAHGFRLCWTHVSCSPCRRASPCGDGTGRKSRRGSHVVPASHGT